MESSEQKPKLATAQEMEEITGAARDAELVPFYKADERTKALLIIGEIGGHEEDFASALTVHRFDKPVFALIAGGSAPETVTMGHAGALVHGSSGSFDAKRAALEAAGVTVFASLGALVGGIKRRLTLNPEQADRELRPSVTSPYFCRFQFAISGICSASIAFNTASSSSPLMAMRGGRICPPPRP